MTMENRFLEDLELVQNAKEVPRDVIKNLPKAYQWQYARIRDDIEVSK